MKIGVTLTFIHIFLQRVLHCARGITLSAPDSEIHGLAFYSSTLIYFFSTNSTALSSIYAVLISDTGISIWFTTAKQKTAFVDTLYMKIIKQYEQLKGSIQSASYIWIIEILY